MRALERQLVGYRQSARSIRRSRSSQIVCGISRRHHARSEVTSSAPADELYQPRARGTARACSTALVRPFEPFAYAPADPLRICPRKAVSRSPRSKRWSRGRVGSRRANSTALRWSSRSIPSRFFRAARSQGACRASFCGIKERRKTSPPATSPCSTTLLSRVEALALCGDFSASPRGRFKRQNSGPVSPMGIDRMRPRTRAINLLGKSGAGLGKLRTP
jgi:hypothetical protein